MIPSFLQKQKHTARNVAKLRRFAEAALVAQRFSGKSSKRRRSLLLSSRRRRLQRLSGGHARADGHRTYPLATARGKSHLTSGPGGNVVVLNGPDGKNRSRHFLLPAWPKLK